jgi:hypothetical protein
MLGIDVDAYKAPIADNDALNVPASARCLESQKRKAQIVSRCTIRSFAVRVDGVPTDEELMIARHTLQVPHAETAPLPKETHA